MNDTLENRVTGNFLRVILVSIFVSSVVTANLISSKMIQVGWLIFPAGTLAYCVTFLCTDIYTEFFGRKETGYVILGGFIANILMVILVLIDIMMPVASFQLKYQEIYSKVLGAAPRITFASMVAYLIAQTHDVYAFHFWGNLTRGRYLWIRNNASTMVSQGIDTVAFSFIAFFGVIPFNALLPMILTLWIFKLIIALLDTPFCYLGVFIVKKMLKIPSIWDLR